MRGLLLGQEKLLRSESGRSLILRDEIDWEPDWQFGALAGVLSCNNSECGETVAVAGSWRVGDAPSPHEQYGEQFFVKYLDPPLHLIEVPTATPSATKGAVEDASRLILINPSAAANRLRQGLEALMDAKKVNKTRSSKPKNGKSRRIGLSLHDRIESFRAQNAEVADLLEAVKWIGNDGSHESELSVEEVMIGARILELALRLLYETRSPMMDRQVKEIIRRKGIL